MDRIGKIALSITCGAVAVVGVIVVASPAHDVPAPRPAVTVTETASPTFSKPPLKPDVWKDGDYVIGEDIAYGTYETAGALDDSFGLCVISSSSAGAHHWPILKSANVDDHVILRITKENAGDVLSVSGCEPLKVRG